MDRLEAAWLHEKFCRSVKWKYDKHEATGVITAQWCLYCGLQVWRYGDDLRYGLDQQAEHHVAVAKKALAGKTLCDLCDGESFYTDTDNRLCHTHFRAARDNIISINNGRAPRCAFYTRPFACRQSPNMTNGFVFLCGAHYQSTKELAEKRRHGTMR